MKALTGTHCSHLYFKFGNAYFQAAIQKSIHEECIISENYENIPATITFLNTKLTTIFVASV